MRVPRLTVEGVELREGAAITWTNFGGIVWTGRGTIVALDVAAPPAPEASPFRFTGYADGRVTVDRASPLEAKSRPVELRMIGVKFQRSPELDAVRAEIRAQMGPPLPHRPDPWFDVKIIPRAYPFGDGDGPVFFTGEAVASALRAGLLVVEGVAS